MPIGSELKGALSICINRDSEERDFVPISVAHRKLRNLAIQKYPNDLEAESQVMTRLSPLVDWLIKPRTIDEFQKLKRDTLELYLQDGSYFDLENLLGEKFTYKTQVGDAVYGKTVVKDHVFKVSEEGDRWQDLANWYLSLSESLNILLKRNIDEEGWSPSSDYMWNRIEGDRPIPGERTQVHQDTKSLRKFLQEFGHKYYKAGIGRVGLVFGDFRVADHGGHGELIRKAKMAVGRKGELVVIAPTKRTILATTQKTECWEDYDRFSRLVSNRFIDHFMMADMPESYYSEPSKYWAEVWKEIGPDLVFLGEENHPLQPVYEAECKLLGGILLINPAPITSRSGNLIKLS